MAIVEHDRRLIETLALVHEANAALHLEQAGEERQLSKGSERQRPWTQHEMLSASGFVISASYWSLVEPRKAIGMYRRAAERYAFLQHSYGMVLALASASEDQIRTMLSVVIDNQAANPQTVAFAMVANEVVDEDRRDVQGERFDTLWQHIGNVPVGRLGIPFDHYARCARAMRAVRRDQEIENFLNEARNYVNRAAEIIRGASHDRFHWRQLRSAILPAEPEAVAMTCAMSMMSHRMLQMPISELSDIDEHGRLLVEVAEEIRNAASGPEPRAA